MEDVLFAIVLLITSPSSPLTPSLLPACHIYLQNIADHVFILASDSRGLEKPTCGSALKFAPITLAQLYAAHANEGTSASND